ncbi:MAG: hypothetical protein IEMM0008_0493 [bacterium]|nr:MAG: hypothetical protein IEMM0008_0493 [bacterium]
MAALAEATDQSFETEVLKASVPVLVDFWAPWCMPCRMQAPILETVQEKLGEKIKIVKVNTDENTAIAQKFKIMSIPTLMIFNGGEVVEQMVGVQNEEKLVSKLTSL